MKTLVSVFALTVSAGTVVAWDGYDYDKGTYVEIDEGNLVRSGEEIEVYEYGEGYKYFDVESIERSGSTVELEVYDHDTNEYRYFEMDD